MRTRSIAAAASVLAVLLTLLTPTAAQAADYPYDGLYNDQTNCTGISTLREATVTTGTQLGTVVGKVQLRYSSVCRTVWIRVIHYYRGEHFDGYVKRNNDGKMAWCGRRGQIAEGWYCLSPMLNDANMTSYAYAVLRYNDKAYNGLTASA